jgi:hypothetical protein
MILAAKLGDLREAAKHSKAVGAEIRLATF